MVRARFSDIAAEPNLTLVQNTMNEVVDYISEVSYGQASVVPAYRGTIDSRSQQGLLLQSVAQPADRADRRNRGQAGRRRTQCPRHRRAPDHRHERFELHGRLGDDRAVAVRPAGRIHAADLESPSQSSPPPIQTARFTHGMLHQFNAVDLYAHEGVTFPRPYVDEWDNMAGTFNNAHPLVWSKERAGWPAAHADTVTFIPRPAPGASYAGLNPIPMSVNSHPDPNRKGIAIGLTQGGHDARRRERALLRRSAHQRARHLRRRAAGKRRADLLRERARAARRRPGHPARQESADHRAGRCVLQHAATSSRFLEPGSRSPCWPARAAATSTFRWTTRRRSPTTTSSSRAATPSTAISFRG